MSVAELKHETDPTAIDILQAAIDRIESGEYFTAVAVLLVTPGAVEYPSVGTRIGLLAAAHRLTHRIDILMDEVLEP